MLLTQAQLRGAGRGLPGGGRPGHRAGRPGGVGGGVCRGGEEGLAG